MTRSRYSICRYFLSSDRVICTKDWYKLYFLNIILLYYNDILYYNNEITLEKKRIFIHNLLLCMKNTQTHD